MDSETDKARAQNWGILRVVERETEGGKDGWEICGLVWSGLVMVDCVGCGMNSDDVSSYRRRNHVV